MIKKQQPPKRLLEMLEMRKAGYSDIELGYHFHISRQRVHKILEVDNLRKYEIDLEKYIVEK
jgi:hypothetical protein